MTTTTRTTTTIIKRQIWEYNVQLHLDAGAHLPPAADQTSPPGTANFSVTSSFLQLGLTPTLRNAQPQPKMSNLRHLCWSSQAHKRAPEAYAALRALIQAPAPSTLSSFTCMQTQRNIKSFTLMINMSALGVSNLPHCPVGCNNNASNIAQSSPASVLQRVRVWRHTHGT